MNCPFQTNMAVIKSQFGVTPQHVMLECQKEKCAIWDFCPANKDGVAMKLTKQAVPNILSEIDQ